MTIPSRTAQPGTYFVTTACSDRRRLFQVERNAQLFLDTLVHYREHYLLHAFVVMPDHVHLLLTPQGITLERVMQFLKGGFSHRLGSKFPVWQRGFTDHRIRDHEDYETRLRYIHENPVGVHLADVADGYPYSSAAGQIQLDGYKAFNSNSIN